jgi:hypothetical protein
MDKKDNKMRRYTDADMQGVSDEFIAQLERIPKKQLERNPDQSCAICANPFSEDPHPLVVRLPCHKDHVFDLEVRLLAVTISLEVLTLKSSVSHRGSSSTRRALSIAKH